MCVHGVPPAPVYKGVEEGRADPLYGAPYEEGDAVTAAAVDEEPEEARRRLRRTMSWSVSDRVEEDTGVPLEEERL